ncbi:MAG: 50S ribosomal protein L6 [Alphaproteobacteria bacterium]|nr:50S ribosomal protein L6 [Alphaproteobacteria bacterium]
MSRIGKNPVEVPAGVQVQVAGQVVKAKGKQGELSMTVAGDVAVEMKDGRVVVTPRAETKRARMNWGTSRALIKNMVQGVSQGYAKALEINGVGYRAQVQGKTLIMQMGYSHDVNYPIPDGINIVCEKPTSIAVSGPDRRLVGQVAAEIRAVRPPEPYKGKGIKYVTEHILRKEGKKK